MGNCVGGEKQPPNFFYVKNINEDKNLVQRGLLEVSESELIYTDSVSADRWAWPLRYLRKYGCDGEVFSFEAGRKCPGGEGLYAFSSKRASKIFEMVARNINQGEQVQQNGEVSPFPSESRQPDLTTMSFVRQQTPPPPPQADIHQESNYTNIGPDGLPLVDTEPSPPPQLPKGQYVPVEFQKPPGEHPAPEPNPNNPPTSYTQIDFEKTEKLNRERLHGTLLDDGNPHRTTGSMSLPPTRTHRHRRLNTVSSGVSSHNRRSSESSFSSQSSLTESSRNLTNGHIAHSIIGEETVAATYQNVILAKQEASSLAPTQLGLYQNVNLGQGNVNDVFSPTAQSDSRYANMGYPVRHHSVAIGNESVTPIRVNGMSTYADVEITPSFRSRATSTPIAQDSYTQLEFSRNPSPKTSDSVASPQNSSSVPQPSLSGQPSTLEVSALQAKLRDERGTSGSEVLSPSTREGLGIIDENRVTYGTLNFPAMAALSETSRARKQEISENNHDISERLENEARERKTSTSKPSTSLFKKSHKEK